MWVVESLDDVEDAVAGLRSSRVGHPLDKFVFERSEKALAHGGRRPHVLLPPDLQLHSVQN